MQLISLIVYFVRPMTRLPPLFVDPIDDQRKDINNDDGETEGGSSSVSTRCTYILARSLFLIVISFFLKRARCNGLQKGGRNVVLRVEHVRRELALSYDGQERSKRERRADARVGHAETRKRRGGVDAVRRTGERHHGTRNQWDKRFLRVNKTRRNM